MAGVLQAFDVQIAANVGGNRAGTGDRAFKVGFAAAGVLVCVVLVVDELNKSVPFITANSSQIPKPLSHLIA